MNNYTNTIHWYSYCFLKTYTKEYYNQGKGYYISDSFCLSAVTWFNS